jgi:hypothetical protein
MPKKTTIRMDRVERLIGVLADKQEKLDNIVALLVEAQIKTQEELRENSRETKERFRETDERFLEMKREADERERRLGERIDKLVNRDRRDAAQAEWQEALNRTTRQPVSRFLCPCGWQPFF